MPRQYHSPSSVSYKCDYAWALRYIQKIREPEIPYALIESGQVKAVQFPTGPGECSYKQRGASLGKAMHAVGEEYYTGHAPAWRTFPGQVFESGLHLLPRPSKCDIVQVERECGTEPIVGEKHAKKGLRIHGILWNMKRDLAIGGRVELAHLGIDAPCAQFDYKSSANVLEYALTPEKLYNDVQACGYAVDFCERFGRVDAPSRWVYFETKKVRRAAPVDVVIPLGHALEIMAAAAEKAERLDRIVTIADAERNLDACCDYSGQPGIIGCSYHTSKGGPCNARRSTGRLITLGAKKETDMIDEAKKAALRAKFAKAKNAEPEPEAEQGEQDTGKEEFQTPTGPAPAPKKGRPKKVAEPESEPVVSSLVELAQDLAEAEERVVSLKAAIIEACS